MYKKLIESKIVRITHEVSFSEGTRAYDIMEELKQVPVNSRLINVENDEDNITVKLQFREEKDIT